MAFLFFVFLVCFFVQGLKSLQVGSLLDKIRQLETLKFVKKRRKKDCGFGTFYFEDRFLKVILIAKPTITRTIGRRIKGNSGIGAEVAVGVGLEAGESV